MFTMAVDREFAHADVKGTCTCSAPRPLVLQERARDLVVEEKARQADQEDGAEGEPC